MRYGGVKRYLMIEGTHNGPRPEHMMREAIDFLK